MEYSYPPVRVIAAELDETDRGGCRKLVGSIAADAVLVVTDDRADEVRVVAEELTPVVR